MKWQPKKTWRQLQASGWVEEARVSAETFLIVGGVISGAVLALLVLVQVFP